MRVKTRVTAMILLVIAVGVVSAAEPVDQPKGAGDVAEVRTEAYVQPPALHWHDTDSDMMRQFHNPTDNLEMGLDIRLREVYAHNIFSLNDSYGDNAANPGNYNNYHWQRYRTRWSTKWHLDDNIDFNTRLVWEFWGHVLPERSFNPFFSEQNYDFDEAIFDHFNIQIRDAFDMPLTLTIGRQDIILGTGWLVLDGTPADGSRTIFFDAIRGTYEFNEQTKMDLIYIQQYDDEEKYIKPFNHHAVQDRRHLTQKGDERGFIAYFTHKAESGQQQELYYMYKDEEASKWSRVYSTPLGRQDAVIHTIGGRLAGPLDDNWSYSAELAKQFGDRDGDTLQALGANTKLTYAFHNATQSEVHVGYEYLSGDDPDTSADEQFDTMWGDWPQYQRGGDLQSYLWTFEGALGEVTNLHRLGFGHSFKPNDVWTIATDYNLMWADENSEPASTAGLNFDSGDNFRGQMLSAIATYSCCKNFKTHFLVDYFIPGSYYDSPSDDNACFARVNVEWTF